MTEIFGTSHNSASLAERGGRLSQFGGVRLSTLGDGPGRGVRVLDFNTGSGLRFSVVVDRAMDIGDMTHNGRSIGWQSPAGIRHPAFNEQEAEDGLGWNRSFSGFLATCGLDHILGPEDVPGDTYEYPRKSIVKQGLHGRISATPARLTGYGESWVGDDCVLWAEGVVEQATLFGEVLHLHRRIEADLGGNEVRLRDRVTNAGFSRTPHMMMYHINLGYPLLDEGSRYLAPVDHVIWASHEGAGLDFQKVGYRTCSPPVRGFTEQVWEYQMAADPDGLLPVAVVNNRLEFGVEIETRADQFPCAYQWQSFRSGNYVMGLEPSTHHVKGDLFARERGEMIWLEAGDERQYQATVRVLDSLQSISASEARITSIRKQPDTEYPVPTNQFPALHRAKRAAT